MCERVGGKGERCGVGGGDKTRSEPGCHSGRCDGRCNASVRGGRVHVRVRTPASSVCGGISAAAFGVLCKSIEGETAEGLGEAGSGRNVQTRMDGMTVE